MSAYYVVKSWERFQHYKDRNPPWIKLHFELLASETWVMLDDASRVLAIACMLIASRNEGKIPNNPDYLKRVAYLNKRPDFTPLIEIGFLEIPLADASITYQTQADARPETETYREETETETEESLIKERGREKVSLDELSTDHILEWLTKKRAKGHYVHHDAELVLEKFKDYCQSKGKKYVDYVAAYRGAFDWEKCKPSTGSVANSGKHGSLTATKMAGTIHRADNRDAASRAHDEGQRIIAERRERWAEEDAAKRGQGGAGAADVLAITDLRQPEHLRGQSPDDGIPRSDVPSGAGMLPHLTH